MNSMDLKYLTKEALVFTAGNNKKLLAGIEEVFSKLPNVYTYSYPVFHLAIPPAFEIEVSPKSNPEMHKTTIYTREMTFEKVSNHPLPGMSWALKI